MENGKVRFAEVQRATYLVDNAENGARVFGVSASVSVMGARVTSVSGGIVTDGAVQVATFRVSENMTPGATGMGGLSIDFLSDVNRAGITAEIDDFLHGVEEAVSGKGGAA